MDKLQRLACRFLITLADYQVHAIFNNVYFKIVNQQHLHKFQFKYQGQDLYKLLLLQLLHQLHFQLNSYIQTVLLLAYHQQLI